jgi:hypothetical protein
MSIRRSTSRIWFVLAAAVAVSVAGWAVSRSRKTTQPAPSSEASLSVVPVRHLRGRAAPSSWRVIQGGGPNQGGGYLVIALRAEDCFTCEDLGRQLREMLHARGAASRRVVVITPRADRTLVEKWLRRERVVAVTLVSSDHGFQLVGADAVPTPAVLLLDTLGQVERGISHPQRVRNVRLVSFAAELALDRENPGAAVRR